MTSDELNILLVDDVPYNLRLLEEILKAPDVNLISVMSGEDALLAIKDNEIAMALIDVRLTDMSGVELAEIIQQDSSRDFVPVLFISAGDVSNQELERCYLKGGAVDFIQKPFKAFVLKSKVRVLIEMHMQKQRISNSENMYKTFLKASPEGIIMMDTQGNITEVSDIICQLFKLVSKNDIIGKKLWDLFIVKQPVDFADLLNRIGQEKRVDHLEFIFRGPDNRQLLCEVSTTAINYEDEVMGYMSIIRDLSERKMIEQQLIRSERMISLGEMSSAMAHEINQPLLSISLSIENLISRLSGGCNEEDHVYIKNKSEKIFDDISRIARIIDHVRSFSRENKDMILTEFSINESISNAISIVTEQFKFHMIRLHTDLSDDLPLISGDTYRFEQVILNLLSNSKDALNERMKNSKFNFAKVIQIRTWLSNDHIMVSVTDNGQGIKPDDIDYIMLPFYTTKEAGKGTGLGLSVSYGIIKELNGNLEIESDPAKGTTFTIKIPARSKSA